MTEREHTLALEAALDKLAAIPYMKEMLVSEFPQARPEEPCLCPVALWLRRELGPQPKFPALRVYRYSTEIHCYGPPYRVEVSHPPRVRAFISWYDGQVTL